MAYRGDPDRWRSRMRTTCTILPLVTSGPDATAEELAGEGPPSPGLRASPPGDPDTSGGCDCRDHCPGDRDTLVRSKGSVSIIP